MIPESEYINHVQRAFPDLDLQDVQINREGMVNAAVIVNHERVFGFLRTEWGVALLHREANALNLVRQYVELTVPHRD